METKITVKEKMSYGIASGGGNIITQLLATFLAAYLTDSVGIAAAAVGTMLLVTRFIDAISDVVMGTIVDKTNTRWGKARPWLLISAPLLLLSLTLMFSIPSSMADGGKIVYMYLSYIFLNCLCYTAFMVPHTSLLSRITLDGYERQKMASINQILNQVGALSVTTFMTILVAKLGWTATAFIYGLATSICILIGFFGTKEHVDEGRKEKVKPVPLSQSIPAIKKNKYFFLLTAYFILLLGLATGPGSATYYFCNVNMNNLGLISVLSACQIVPLLLINLFVPTLTKKFGRRTCMLSAAIVNAIGGLCIGIAGLNTALVVFGSILKGASQGVLFACGFAMSADVVDYGEWKTSIRSEGLINSCVSFGQKVGLGFGPAIATWIIAAGGYDGLAAVQTESAKAAINFSFGYLGVIIAILMIVVSYFMNIDKEVPDLREQLEARRK